MKKTLMSLAFASLFTVGAVQAEDHAATVNISGSVTESPMSECTVTTAQSSITLTTMIDNLPAQGADYNGSGSTIGYGVSSNDGSSCQNKVALQLRGVADDADGTTLANSDFSASGAKGVGIAFYDSALNALEINNNTIPFTNSNLINVQMVKLTGQTPVAGSIRGSLILDIIRL